MPSEEKRFNKHESVNLNSTPLMLWGLAEVSSQEETLQGLTVSGKVNRIFIKSYLKLPNTWTKGSRKYTETGWAFLFCLFFLIAPLPSTCGWEKGWFWFYVAAPPSGPSWWLEGGLNLAFVFHFPSAICKLETYKLLDLNPQPSIMR